MTRPMTPDEMDEQGRHLQREALRLAREVVRSQARDVAENGCPACERRVVVMNSRLVSCPPAVGGCGWRSDVIHTSRLIQRAFAMEVSDAWKAGA